MAANSPDSDNTEGLKAKYWAICWILSVLSVCTFFSIWVYCYYTNPNPDTSTQVRQAIQNQVYLEKRVVTLEAVVKDIKIIADIKKKYEE